MTGFPPAGFSPASFSPEWLRLREPADARARNLDVAAAMSGRFALRDAVAVADLGSGTGANLRATSALLPNRQSWTLIDHDPALHEAARRELSSWADAAAVEGDGLRLSKDRATIDVRFKVCDLARDPQAAFEHEPNLVTAAAFFDLVSADFIRLLAGAIAERRAAFYAVLTYNGVQRWQPHRPADNQMTSAFHRHQMRDKGFGPAAGPTAPGLLADQFQLEGYSVLEGESPWRLSRGDRMLVEELSRGHAMAVAETGIVDNKVIESWIKVQRSGADVGHTDIFAAPV